MFKLQFENDSNNDNLILLWDITISLYLQLIFVFNALSITFIGC